MCASRVRFVTTWLVLLSHMGPVESVESGWERMDRWRDVVRVEGACALPGVSIKYDTFVPAMWKAVQGGFISHDDAVFCGEGLRYGFTCGVNVERLQGHRWFANYPTAVEHRSPVTAAVLKRVSAEKTVDLGRWNTALAAAVRAQHVASIIFPMGAVPKNQLLEPGAYRPTDDHTRTGLNAATDLTGLAHSLTAYSDIARFLKHNFLCVYQTWMQRSHCSRFTHRCGNLCTSDFARQTVVITCTCTRMCVEISGQRVCRGCSRGSLMSWSGWHVPYTC